ncbi:MAG: hypothetical protein NC131_12155 [Roseburia sp.]|nr:hypothetical protein [Roseburia sp.]
MKVSKRQCKAELSFEENQIPKAVKYCGYFDKNPSWRFSKGDDKHGKWSPYLVMRNDTEAFISKLKNFESRLWSDIISDRDRNHFIEIYKLAKCAQKRCDEICLVCDELFSLRLSGRERLFGVIEDGVFYIIWYDKDHEICPSLKKHT